MLEPLQENTGHGEGGGKEASFEGFYVVGVRKRGGRAKLIRRVKVWE